MGAPERNDLPRAMLSLPLSDCFIGPRLSRLELSQRHDEAGASHADVHAPVADFVFWHIFNERGQPGFIHTHLLPITPARDNGAAITQVINPTPADF
jgi:hypothetical protein